MDKNSADKIQLKDYKGIKDPYLVPIRVNKGQKIAGIKIDDLIRGYQ